MIFLKCSSKDRSFIHSDLSSSVSQMCSFASPYLADGGFWNLSQGLRHKWMLTTTEHYVQNLVYRERKKYLLYI